MWDCCWCAPVEIGRLYGKLTPWGSAPGEGEQHFCGPCVCLGKEIGFLIHRVSFATPIISLGCSYCCFERSCDCLKVFLEQSTVLYHPPLFLIKCIISFYFLPNNDLCVEFSSMWASGHPHHTQHHLVPLAAKATSLPSSLCDSFLCTFNLGGHCCLERILCPSN